MIPKIEDIIKLVNESIEQDQIVVENYKKVVEILDNVNQDQAKVIFDQMINNHEVATAWTKKFSAKSKMFQTVAKRTGISPAHAQQLEMLQQTADKLGELRSDLEKQIGKSFLDKGFLTKEIYNKYYN